MTLQDIENHVSFIASLIAIVVFILPIGLWLQRRFLWIDRVTVFLFKIGQEERDISQCWKEGLAELEPLTSDAKLYSFRLDGMPKLRKSDEKELKWMKENGSALSEVVTRHQINKTHALAVGTEFRSPGNHIIDYVQSDFDMVEAARTIGIAPPIISANAIIFCPATEEVLLMQRSSKTHTYPRAIHFLGGNYEPALGTQYFDDVDKVSPLRRAALREVEEESGLKLRDPPKAIVLVGEELKTGFVQFTYAGLAVTADMRKRVEPSPEGWVGWVPFKELVQFSKTGRLTPPGTSTLDHGGIVPSCALTLMMWLKMGAPDQNRKTPIHEAAINTYNKLLPNIAKRLAPYAPL